MNIGKPFKSIASYNNAMSKDIDDKLFFIDFLPKSPMLIVDFGCADGTLISKMYELYNDSTLIRYIGFDISEEMINLAKSKFDHCTDRVKFTNNWDDVEKELLSFTEYKVLVLSSVIHEVYSYGTEESIREFWDRVIYSGFHYICVRDMMYSEDMDRQTNPLTSHRYGLGKLTKAPLNTCLKEFEEKWGKMGEFYNTSDKTIKK